MIPIEQPESFLEENLLITYSERKLEDEVNNKYYGIRCLTEPHQLVYSGTHNKWTLNINEAGDSYGNYCKCASTEEFESLIKDWSTKTNLKGCTFQLDTLWSDIWVKIQVVI